MAKATYPLEFRKRFVEGWAGYDGPFTDYCALFGVTRETGYEWRARYRDDGVAGLEARSSAPHYCPHATPAELEELVIAARKAHPTWGPRKLRERLIREHGGEEIPVPSTIGEILKRAGMVRPRKRRRYASPSDKPFAACDAPNDVWTIDFKGQFRTRDRSLCYPLTLADSFSRYLLRCDAYAGPTEQVARRSCIAAFRTYGLPRVIHSDNGTPFSSTAPGGLSRLNIWWIRLGIVPQRIRPGKPAENGRHERMHRTLKAEAASPPGRSLTAQQRRFERFRREYNELRPHEALGQTPPAQSYSSSPRPYPRKLPELEYPTPYDLRIVKTGGHLKWRGRSIFVSEVLRGEVVGVLPVSDEISEVYFGPVLLGTLSEVRPDLGLVRPPRIR